MADDPWADFNPSAAAGGAADPWADFSPQATTPAQPQQSSGYSLGPISDVGELGARGINWLAQQLPESIRPAPRAPGPMGQPVNLPGIGQPSAVGMAQGLYQTGEGAVTLPGDVYAGKVDPLSEEGIRRAADLASLTPLATVPSVARSAGTGKALSAAEIESQASRGYDALRDSTRASPIGPGELDRIASAVRQETMKGPSPKVAPRTYQEIEGLKTPAVNGDLGDLLDTRRNLMGIVREGGTEGNAALRAVQAVDQHLGPDLTKMAKDLDKNWAITKGAQEVEAKIANAIREAETSGSGGNIGNKIRQALRPMLKDDRISPEVRQAIEDAVRPGSTVNLLRPLSIFDPTTHKLSAFGEAFAALHSFNPAGLALPVAGYAARKMYDRIIKNRAAQVSAAMRSEAPASLAQPGFRPAGLVAQQTPIPLPFLSFAETSRDRRY